ncbi:hypothetical protein BDP27DRAFT_1469554 [Rhodocollybia butyracea]|uniref:Uncharacterized protein n=1 Tax=Rhodocollybia butyracea TaxID=206335 RepID=A0A9P5Q3T4_9AGAR|nr:hypothetical protein BDP27DRAFT_1366080 [Rhodocollybia butyracea]KAF9074546.1 hypothetical protein BDP27DRAFT_1469554 [Rhodocollybia butyracea]
MLFNIPYTSALLAASLSCIWATPIAVNRDTLQRRSESELSSRATENGSLEARGLGFDSLSTVHAIHGRAPHPKVVTDFDFVRRVYPITVDGARGVASTVMRFLAHALPGVGIPNHESLSHLYHFGPDTLAPSKQYFIVEFKFKLDNVEYQGVVMNPTRKIEADGSLTETRGIMYRERSRFYPAPPKSLIPGFTAAQLNPAYKPVYTGHWITDFAFFDKVILDKSTAKKDADKIALLAQAYLAYVLPHVETFGITGSLYNYPSNQPLEEDPAHLLEKKNVQFAFRLQEVEVTEKKGNEGGQTFDIVTVEYRCTLKDPLGTPIREVTGGFSRRVLPREASSTSSAGPAHVDVKQVKTSM